jgi:hypothetical protein
MSHFDNPEELFRVFYKISVNSSIFVRLNFLDLTRKKGTFRLHSEAKQE